MKSENQKIAEQARKLYDNPKDGPAMRAAWARVTGALDVVFLAKRPKMRVFEVHHAKEVARAAFLRAAVVDKKNLQECEEIAFRAVDSP